VGRYGGVPGEGWVGLVCAVAVGGLVLFPLGAVADDDVRTRATATKATGSFYGGATSQGLPVVIKTNKSGRKVNALIAISLKCTSGGVLTLPDVYSASVSKKGKFSKSFGPEPSRNPDGTSTDFEGSISGSFNKARTKVSGKWSFKGTDRDAAGAVTDTCDSGSVSWLAKQ
jgi:hypothetical protein